MLLEHEERRRPKVTVEARETRAVCVYLLIQLQIAYIQRHRKLQLSGSTSYVFVNFDWLQKKEMKATNFNGLGLRKMTAFKKQLMKQKKNNERSKETG